MKFDTWIKTEKQNTKFYIGLVGYSGAKFDEKLATTIIKDAFEDIQKMLTLTKEVKKEPVLVSGLTNLGIPKIGYSIATELCWDTIGISAKEALQYECFNVTEKIIVGDNFGDESDSFISMIDCLVRVGGRKTIV